MSYNVYLVSYMGVPLDHHAIFVEAQTDGGGFVYHVIGSIQGGMTFEAKEVRRPELSNTFVEKTYIGWVSADSLHRIEETCLTIPPPKKQYQGSRRLHPKEPLRRCQEWADEAVNALIANAVIQTQQATSSNTQQASNWIWSEEHQDWYQANSDGTFTWLGSGAQSADTSKEKKKGKGKK